MRLNTHYRPGFRAIKSCVSVFFCLLLSFLLGNEHAMYAAISAIVCTQITYTDTKLTGLRRLVGTALGGAVGFLVLEYARRLPYYREWLHIFIIPLGMLFLIYLCNVIFQRQAVVICCVVFLSIAVNFDGTILDTAGYAVNRVLSTSSGVIIAMLVDRLLPSAKDAEGAATVEDGAEAPPEPDLKRGSDEKPKEKAGGGGAKSQ